MCSVGFVFQSKKNTLGPHDASDGGVMRLRITQWATRDQDGDRIETLTTYGQWFQAAGASPTVGRTTQGDANPPTLNINRRSTIDRCPLFYRFAAE